jgi:hypothetical protein
MMKPVEIRGAQGVTLGDVLKAWEDATTLVDKALPVALWNPPLEVTAAPVISYPLSVEFETLLRVHTAPQSLVWYMGALSTRVLEDWANMVFCNAARWFSMEKSE